MGKLGRAKLGCAFSAAFLAVLCGSGCAPLHSARGPNSLVSPQQLLSPQTAEESAAPIAPTPPRPSEPKLQDDTGPLTLSRLITLALESHPDLAIAQARVEAARGQLIQAGLYPNPTIGWIADEMGQPINGAGFQGPFIGQDIVTANKLELAQAAATRDVAAADWQAVTRRFELTTRVRSAYYDVLTAQRAVEENERIVGIARESLRVATHLLEQGKGIRPDKLRAEVELSQSQIRLAIARQNLEAAWRVLAATVGVPEFKSRTVVGSLEQPAPRYEWASALPQMLERSSELRAAQATVERMQAMLARAEADAIPNINVRLHPFYTFPDQRFELSLETGVNLPIFNRNQGNIRSAQADVVRAGEEARLLELQLVQRLTTAFQRYRNALAEVERYKNEILPKALEAFNAVKTGYDQGAAGFDYTAVLQAQQTLVQAQLAYIQSLNELWKAASDIAGLLQEEVRAP